MASTEGLGSLSRLQLQKRAKEAGIKANQSSEVLIKELSSRAKLTPKSRNPRITFGSELSESKANQILTARKLKTLCEDAADADFPHSPALDTPCFRQRHSPGQDRLQMTFSPIEGSRLSTSSVASCSSSSSPSGTQRSLVEMSTFDFTIARLKALGFAEEEARWAANQAQDHRESEGADHDSTITSDLSLSLDMSTLCLDDKPLVCKQNNSKGRPICCDSF